MDGRYRASATRERTNNPASISKAIHGLISHIKASCPSKKGDHL